MNPSNIPPTPLRIELAWPSKELSPNSRVHHMALWRAKKTAKEAAGWTTRAAVGNGSPNHFRTGARLPLKITAQPPAVKRDRDADNVIASLKAAIDGVACALGVDDSLFDPSFSWGEPSGNGKIVVEVGA